MTHTGNSGQPWLPRLISAAAFVIAVSAVIWSLGVFWRLGIEVYAEQVLSVIMGLSLFIIYVTTDIKGKPKKGAVGYLDWGMALLAVATTLYFSVDYRRLTEDLYFNPIESFIVGFILVVLTVEGLRRSAGWALTIIFLVFFIYALFGHLVPGALQGRSVPLERLVPILGMDASAMFGPALEVVGTIVIAFILMGQLLFATGGGEFFTDLSKALMGRTRGGSAKISVIASAFFGTISGSVVANVTSTGIITIPMMKRAGFKPHVAGAVEAVASNGGQLMPPVMGAAAFLMADFLGVGYGTIVIAATIPALLYFFAVFVQIDLEAAKMQIPAEDANAIPKISEVLKEGWSFLVPFAVLIIMMFSFNMSPEASALIATATIAGLGFIRGYRGRRLKPKDIIIAFKQTGDSAVQILVICGVAGMIISVLNVTGLGFALSLLLTKIGEGSLFGLLTMTAIVCIILGMSMPTTSLYILLATLVVPSLINLGALPLAAHMFVFYFGLMSFVTPPVALAAFAAANIAGAEPMRTGWYAVRFGWAAYIVPYLFIYSPSLLMVGDPITIILSVVTALIGITVFTTGIMGFMKAPLSLPKRVLGIISGAGLLLPVDIFPGAGYVNLICFIGATVLAGTEYWNASRQKAAILQ
ncbi:TRAP transporter permease [Ferrovibrio sp.]|uniref:TRAP transporter permease n=1 Tax=Ferrovibrio sp. TaxID=1917215 RepID=UPI0035B49AA6